METLLAQTDTTVGFLSQDEIKLSSIKLRAKDKPFLKIYRDLRTLKKEFRRVPNSKKNLLRRSKKTTFIVKNQAFRVVDLNINSHIIREYKWFYSTSANKAGHNYDRDFCENSVDIVIENRDGLYENQASTILKINNKKIEKLR